MGGEWAKQTNKQTKKKGGRGRILRRCGWCWVALANHLLRLLRLLLSESCVSGSNFETWSWLNHQICCLCMISIHLGVSLSRVSGLSNGGLFFTFWSREREEQDEEDDELKKESHFIIEVKALSQECCCCSSRFLLFLVDLDGVAN